MAALPDARDIIDLARYPIDRPDSQAYDARLAAIRSELEDDGCAVLKGFVRSECLSDLEAEAERAAPFAQARSGIHCCIDGITANFHGSQHAGCGNAAGIMGVEIDRAVGLFLDRYD